MEALKIILTKVQEGKLDIEEALILIEAIGVNKENKTRDLILDPQESPVIPGTPVSIPWAPNPTSPYIRERIPPIETEWNKVTCGTSGNIGINKSNTSITN